MWVCLSGKGPDSGCGKEKQLFDFLAVRTARFKFCRNFQRLLGFGMERERERENYINVSPFSTRIVLIFCSMPRYVLLQKYHSSQISAKLWCTACALLYFKPFLKQGTVTLNSLWAFRNSSSVYLHLTCILMWKTGHWQARILTGRGSESLAVYESTEFHSTGSEVNVII